MYNFTDIDKKWQDRWLETGVFNAVDFSEKPKKYLLVEFPFPSGAGLHVGHPRSYVGLDTLARKYRMQGFNVLYPMGWDAFGLPTENYAIKTGRPPAEVTAENIATFKRQIQSLGLSFDWSREVDSTDPGYYKWTQWQFLQFFKAGLAYKTKTFINWCPKDKIGLANEEAQGGVCERCGGPVEKREKEQWMIGITKYADRLIDDLATVDYLPKIRKQQEEWVGRSEGAEVEFTVAESDKKFRVFTTRPDTLFGVTYVTLAPEHALVSEITTEAQRAAVEEYVAAVARKTEMERTDATREKTGVFTGAFAVNPVNGEHVPVWISDYVLVGYGTGAVMAVPAHDERDFEFAKKFGLEVKEVVAGGDGVGPFTDEGIAINSEFLDGLTTADAKQKMIAFLEEKKVGARKVTYKLRDWVFSRQRYWGEPIPLVHCDSCAEKKQKALLIHGFSADGNGVWFPFLKEKMEEAGFDVVNPTISSAAHPSVTSWNEEIVPHLKTLSDDDVIVAHSIGAKAVLHAIVEAKKKIGTLILVAPAIGKVTEEQWSAKKQERPNMDIDALRSLWEAQIDLEEVSVYVDSVQVVFSEDDSRVPVVGHEVFPRGWYIHKLKGHGHFFAAEIPELAEIVLSAKNSGWIPVPDSELPLTLPYVDKYEPTDNGESPLALIPDWVKTKCPRCGGDATRETDTMPNWAGSSWYFLRYVDAHNTDAFAAAEKLKYWMPIDLYNGGMEHTTLHLLYSRFWNKFMHDSGFVPTSEPYARRVSHGLIMAEDGTKMSKSKGNVVNPDEIVREFGADTLRMYEMFIGPFSEPAPWSMNGVSGVKRFLDRVMRLVGLVSETESDEVTRGLHKMIKAVTEDYDRMSFNTVVAHYMTFVNTVYSAGGITQKTLHEFLRALNVAAPHVAEEVWMQTGGTGLVCEESWPTFDPTLVVDAEFELVVQVNGKVRDKIRASSSASEEELRALALSSIKIQELLGGTEPKKIVIVPGKLVSIVM